MKCNVPLHFVFLSIGLLMGGLFVGGCSSQGPDAPAASSSDPVAAGGGSAGDGSSAETSGAAGGSQPFELGNALEPFDPPSLEEVDAQTNWIDRPVASGMAKLRAALEEAESPELSAAAALRMRNDSDEANEKIKAALGQLAPPDGSGVDYDGRFVRHVTGDLGSTNPLFAQTVTEFEYSSLTGTSILSFDREFDYFAPEETVVSWQTSEDRMMDKFVLRDDLTWSDGRPLTAHDLVYSFQVIMSDHDELVIPAVRQGTDELKAVVAYDDQTVVFFHKDSLSTNTVNIQFPILPKHVYTDTIPQDPSMKSSDRHTELEDNPVVSGPYTLSRRVRGQEFVVQRREGYYMHNGKNVRDKPYFAEVRVKVIEDPNTALLALKAGDIDEMQLRPEQWESQTTGDDFYERNTKATALAWTNFNFVWNMNSKYFDDKRVRWAMSYAFDYDEFLTTIGRGLYTQGRGTFHPTSPMFPDEGAEALVQDLDKAEDLLDEAGWDDSDGDGIRDKEINGQVVPFEFSLMTYQNDTGVQTATLMKECLDQIGIICHVKPTEFTVQVQKLTDGEFDAAMNGWGTGANPDTSSNLWMTGEPRNYPRFADNQVDELFLAARREFDEEKRMDLYGQIHKILWDAQPYTWLFYRNDFFAFSKKLRGYNFSPRGPYGFDPGASSIYIPAASP